MQLDFSIDKSRGWKKRPCPLCNKPRTEKGHDACIADLPGVVGACCGHGQHEGYVEFPNGISIHGFFR